MEQLLRKNWQTFFLVTLALTIIANLFRASLADYGLGILALGLILYFFKYKRKIRFSRPSNITVLVFGFFLSAIFGYLNTGLNKDDIAEILQMRWLLAIPIIFYSARIANPINLEKIKKLLFSLAIITLALVLWQLSKPASEWALYGFDRFMGLYHHPNNFALALLIPWAISLGITGFELSQKRKVSPLITISFLIFTLALLGSYTRSAWIGALAAGLLALFYFRNKAILIVASAFGVITSIAIKLDLLGLKDRLLYSLDVSKGSSTETRFQLWKVNFRMLLDHPFFGVGFEKNIRLLPEYYSKMGLNETFIAHAHNQFIQILAGTGIVGFFTYMASFVTMIIFFQKSRASTDEETKCIATAANIAIIAFLFGGFFESPLMFHEVRNYLIMFIGAAAGIIVQNRANEFKAHQ